jgi:hypothetical protein
MSLNRLLKYIQKEQQGSFKTDFFDFLASFSDNKVAFIDKGKYADDVIDACAQAYEVNASDIRDNKKRSRQINSAKLHAAFFMSKVDREDAWSADRLGVTRGTFLYRMRQFANLFETEQVFRSYYSKIVFILKERGYGFEFPN